MTQVITYEAVRAFVNQAVKEGRLSLVIEVVREAQQERVRETRADFNRGDIVWFNARGRGTQIGRVEGKNPKTIKVMVPSQFGGPPMQWRVGPTVLNHANDEQKARFAANLRGEG